MVLLPPGRPTLCPLGGKGGAAERAERSRPYRASRSRNRSTWSVSSASRARAVSTTAAGAFDDEGVARQSCRGRHRASLRPGPARARVGRARRRPRRRRRPPAGGRHRGRPPGSTIDRSPAAVPGVELLHGQHAMERAGPGQPLDRRAQRLERGPERRRARAPRSRAGQRPEAAPSSGRSGSRRPIR